VTGKKSKNNRKGAKTPRKTELIFIFFFSKSLALLCVLASLRLIFILLFFASLRLGG